MLRATATCNFSFLIWPGGTAPAALASPFSTLLTHKSLEQHCVSQLSKHFAHVYLFSSNSFSSTLFFCFSSLHIVGSLTSKLPLIIQSYSAQSNAVVLTLEQMGSTSKQKFVLLETNASNDAWANQHPRSKHVIGHWEVISHEVLFVMRYRSCHVRITQLA